jgi:hypothetical protein
MRTFFLLVFISSSVFGLEVIKPVTDRKIELRIIRAEPDSFETYSLMNANGREMLMVCAGNRVYDNNPKAFIQYRNYYNEIAGEFTIADNKVCLEMGKFLEQSAFGVSETNPFIIQLSTRSMNVERIVYPKIDPFSDRGTHKDLLPRKPVYIPDNNADEDATTIRRPKPEVM